jgi:hypothetical protein
VNETSIHTGYEEGIMIINDREEFTLDTILRKDTANIVGICSYKKREENLVTDIATNIRR